MKNFLGYRPHGQRPQWYTWPDGAELRLNRWEDIPQNPGFVYAPFEPSESCPILWISSKNLIPMAPQQAEISGNNRSEGGIESMPEFVERVEEIKQRCSNGNFQKVVISRVVMTFWIFSSIRLTPKIRQSQRSYPPFITFQNR